MARSSDLLAIAEHASAASALVAQVTIEEILDPRELKDVADVIGAIWPSTDQPVIAPSILRAFAHAGNYVAAARAKDRLVGAAIGIFGEHDRNRVLHSHIVGVLPEARSTGVGFALKLHQRVWALRRRIKVVTWTFDPLVRANAYFNVTILGAQPIEYHDNFYGELSDTTNTGDETDRLLVEWRLRSSRCMRALNGSHREPDLDAMLARGASILLGQDRAGRPITGDDDAAYAICHVPRDILELRNRDHGLAREWRLAVREALGSSIRKGFAVSAFARSGWYALKRSPTSDDAPRTPPV